MVRIAHVSDLHFGTEDTVVAAALAEDLRAFAPDLLVVSGDLTQRARTHEFAAARAWLDALPFPRLAVPGNHDLPLWHLFDRAVRPLARFQRAIGAAAPLFRDRSLAVMGINTARAGTVKSGRISRDQILALTRFFAGAAPEALRVVVAHHQFIAPLASRHNAPLGRMELAVHALREARVDLLLAGHLHHAFSDDLAAHWPACGRSIVVAQAGTAISQRRGAQGNAWNAVTSDGAGLLIAVRGFRAGAFGESAASRWRHGAGGWIRVDQPLALSRDG
ncbi:MAG TPA: metallophosphoesterase [Planctomycetota bacterium]|nr:metallophosphoesterase [Planctomycetota bacterium]